MSVLIQLQGCGPKRFAKCLFLESSSLILVIVVDTVVLTHFFSSKLWTLFLLPAFALWHIVLPVPLYFYSECVIDCACLSMTNVKVFLPKGMSACSKADRLPVLRWRSLYRLSLEVLKPGMKKSRMTILGRLQISLDSWTLLAVKPFKIAVLSSKAISQEGRGWTLSILFSRCIELIFACFDFYTAVFIFQNLFALEVVVRFLYLCLNGEEGETHLLTPVVERLGVVLHQYKEEVVLVSFK